MNKGRYELYHYGVKGMKWGVRRYRKADGTLTPAGKRRLVGHMKDTFADNYSKANVVRKWHTRNGIKEVPDKDYSSALDKTRKDLRDDIRHIYDHPELKRARDKYHATMKIGEDFYNNKKLLNEFRNKAYLEEVNHYAKKYGEKGDWVDTSYGEHVTRRSLKTMHMRGDRDHSEFGSFNTYLKSKGLDTHEYHRNVQNASREYRDECKNVTKKMLGVYGNRTVADYTLEKDPFTGKPGRRIKQSAKDMVDWMLTDMERDERNRRKLDGSK